ncbi:hypothetical protein ABNF65_19230 [Paenibacillus larvae]
MENKWELTMVNEDILIISLSEEEGRRFLHDLARPKTSKWAVCGTEAINLDHVMSIKLVEEEE